MEYLNAEILETLRCPCCFEFMMNCYIYICRSGHNICNACSGSEICPVCKKSVTDTRNLSLETISNIVYYPCKNRAKGCVKSVLFCELEKHHYECDFRNYRCRLNERCFWESSRNDLKNHYLDKHDKNILIGNESSCLWKAGKTTYTVYLMMAHNEMFYVHAKIHNNIFYWIVQYIGRSEDVILYCFEIHVYTDQFKDRKLVFSEICHDDVTEDVDDIIASGFCVGVPMAVFETYATLEQTVFYTILIKRT